MISTRPLLILHHGGDIQEELQAFLSDIQARVIVLEEFESGMELTHVVTSGDQDFNQLGQHFNTNEDDVKIIALGVVKDYPSFIANNGRFIVDQKWFTEPMGKVALEKFFKGQASVHLEENFPKVKDGAHFKVMNHLRIGADMDRLSAFIHAHDGPVVNVRTFVDHAVYYLFYLKQAGIAGAPFEVDYGDTGSETVVQIHLPVKNYVAEYLLDSFGHATGQDPLRYLLAICAQSTDYLEIQYIQSAAKLVLTGLWQKRKGVRTLRFSCLMINHVSTTAQIERQIEEQLLAAKRLPDQKIEELNEKPLPGHLLEMVMPEAAHEGYLKDHPDLARNLVAFAIDQWKEKFPGQNIAEVTESQMTDLLTEYFDSEEISKLGEADLHHVLERVRKNNVSKAYEQEIERVRENLKTDEKFQQKLQDNFADKIAEKIAGGLAEEDLANLVKGQIETPDVPVVVPGSEGELDAGIMVKGVAAKDDLIQKISGSLEEDICTQMIKGAPMKTDDFIMRVSKGLGDSVKGDWKYKTNLTENIAPEKVRYSLERFAAKMGQTLDKLNSSDLQVFAQSELPKILDQFVTVDETFVIPETVLPELPDYKFKATFQAELKSRMEKLYPGKTPDEVAGIITAEDQEKLLREIVKDTVKVAVQTSNPSDEVMLVKSLSGALKTEEQDVVTIIKGSRDEVKKVESEQVIQSLFAPPAAQANGANTSASGDAANTILIQRLRQIEKDFNDTKGKLDAAMTEIRVLKDARAQMLNIEHKTQQAVKEELKKEIVEAEKISVDKIEEILPIEKKISIIQDLSSGKTIDERDTQKLKEALEREQKILAAAKQAETDIRKVKLEMKQKESFFQQEIEKANRALKSRDLVVQKAKDGLALIMVKKDKEIKDLNNKISALVTSQATTDQANQLQRIKGLEQEKNSLSKLVDVYKNKLTSMATNMQKQGVGGSPKKDEEVRKINMEKQRLEVANQAFQKELTKLKSRMELDKSEVQRLRVEKSRLEDALKSAISTSGPVQQNSNAKIEDQTKKIQDLQRELLHSSQNTSRYEMSVKELEQKVTELTQQLQKGAAAQADQANKGKSAQMEATVKKISADLATAANQMGESKKEINKLRSENTALKNMLEKLKKDMEKSARTGAAPGKKAS